jgi:hypothetical protein
MQSNFRLFEPGIDDPDFVLQLRAKAQQLLLEGKTIMSWEGEGTSVGKQFTLPIMDVLRETRYFLLQVNQGFVVRQVKVAFA